MEFATQNFHRNCFCQEVDLGWLLFFGIFFKHIMYNTRITQGLPSNDLVPGLRGAAIWHMIVDSLFKCPVLQLAILADTIKIYVCSFNDSRSLFWYLTIHPELYHNADSTKISHHNQSFSFPDGYVNAEQIGTPKTISSVKTGTKHYVCFRSTT